MKITRKDLDKSIVELVVEETAENIAKQRKKCNCIPTNKCRSKRF